MPPCSQEKVDHYFGCMSRETNVGQAEAELGLTIRCTGHEHRRHEMNIECCKDRALCNRDITVTLAPPPSTTTLGIAAAAAPLLPNPLIRHHLYHYYFLITTGRPMC